MKKPSPGMVATANRIEALPTIQNALKNIGDQEELAFLKGPADTAIAILHTIQNIEDGEIDVEFVNLALDACGLVYIVIHQCAENVNQTTVISRDMRLDAEELDRNLNAAQIFAQKKASGSISRRLNPRKRSEDKQKIAEYHRIFKAWMLKFGAGSHGSIHDSLQETIDKKINEREQHAIAARKAKENPMLASLGRITSDMANIRINDDDRSRVDLHTPPKQMTMPEPMAIPSPPPAITISDTHAHLSDATPPIPMPSAPLWTGNAAEKTHGSDDWYAMRRAEKERWRKSEQDFANLPPATPDDDLKPPFHLPQNPGQMPSETPTTMPSISREDDATILRALQERFPELNADERHAILVAGRLQLQREDQRRQASNRHQRGSSSNWSNSDEDISPRPGPHPSSSRRSHPASTNPESLYSNSENYLHSDGVSGHSSSPDNSFQGHPPGLSPYGSMRFEDIKYSGISLGGGPVNVRNINTGNTTNITYHDSLKDNSVRNYYSG